jgi:hypothetical protein
MGASWLTRAIPFIADAVSARRQYGAVSKYNVQTPAEKQAFALYQALSDPNSPLLAQMAQEEEAQGASGLLSTIRAMQNADRRQGALGRQNTFFNPERADEAVDFLTSRGMPGIAQQAKQTAMDRILRSAQGMTGQIAPQAARQERALGQKMELIESQGKIPQQLLDIFSATRGPTPDQISKFYQPAKPGSSTYFNNVGRVDWNRQ